VIASDVPERVDGGDHDRAEGQGDHPQIGHGERRVAVDHQGGGDRAHPDEHQECSPDGFSAQPLEQIRLVKHGVPLVLEDCLNIIRYCRIHI
jgi:hypothetical protein